MASSCIEVATYGRYGSVQVAVPRSGKVGELIQTLGKQIGLKPSSIQCFALYKGDLESPEYRIEPFDNVSRFSRVCLRRHGLDLRKEHKLLKIDDVAVHLLFSEALAHYRRNDESALEPTEEQKEKLEEYLDPSFTSERQFLETALDIQGYTSMIFEGVTSKTKIDHKECIIPEDTAVNCICCEKHLHLHGANGVKTHWGWRKIRRWKLVDQTTATLEVTNIQGNAGVMQYIYITSKQAPLLLQTAKFFCTELVYKEEPSKRPVENPDGPIVGRTVDPLYEFMNLALFGSGPRFTSIH